MKLFTVGPVQMYPETLDIEGTQLPYFRTPDFSRLMLQSEELFLDSVNAPANACFIGLTCSGTGAMDAAVTNLLTEDDLVLVINGGSFGERFAQICSYYRIPFTTYDIGPSESFSEETFERQYAKKGYTALLVNACDTGSGRKYDLDYLGQFCRRNHMLFIVDAVSAYLADPIDMKNQGIDALFTASQKALALSPGAAFVALSRRAQDRLEETTPPYYFNFRDYIENQRRGQPPFTSAVGIFLAFNRRLKRIMNSGIDTVISMHAERAAHFRKGLSSLPLQIPDYPLSNCCTPILFPENNADYIYELLKTKYQIFLTPSGGELKPKQLRVGHLGNLTLTDFDDLLSILSKELSV